MLDKETLTIALSILLYDIIKSILVTLQEKYKKKEN